MICSPPLRVLLACAALAPAAHKACAASFTVEHSFSNPALPSAGANTPYAGLVRDGAGHFFGTSYGGGEGGGGAVFELSPPANGGGGWSETILHSFSAHGGTDGLHPMGALILGRRGVLYGTTSAGGGPRNAGGGTVFALTPPVFPWGAWMEKILYVFPAGAGTPAARLLQDGGGALYGTALAGGTGSGSVFRLTPPVSGQADWTQTTLYRFGAHQDDGEAPLSGLVLDAEGALYGTTESTGSRLGNGTVYRLTAPGAGTGAGTGTGTGTVSGTGTGAWSERIVFNFPSNGGYGSRPDGDLLVAGDGTLYGTAVAGGARNGGTVFRLSPPQPGKADWACSILYSFTGHFGDAGPEGGVVFGPEGTLMGTTSGSVRHQQGTVYQLIPGTSPAQSWSEQILARFPTLPTGGGLFPVGDLVAAGSGYYVGVTELGGAGGVGTVYSVAP